MRNPILAAIALLVLVVSSGTLAPPATASPPTWSLHRASLGVHATGAVTNDSDVQSSAFYPGAYLSWSATSGLSLAATYDRDFARHLSIGQAGIRFLLLKSDRGQVGLGANLVGYGDEGAAGLEEPTSWTASLHGSWSAAKAKNGATLLWGIASASYDPENDRREVRVGLRYQLIGGAPWIERTEP